jgi:Tol biopolymer transport system component/DNA-binding winged helix-turn-helix (wHTH) protein
VLHCAVMQAPANQGRSLIRFGVCELDVRAGELRRNGVKVKLQEQPLQILAMLLECPGEIVTREELRARLWSADTFVDFDHGLNSAVKRLRDALGDSAEKPRFVETLGRRGYRFIAALVCGLPASGIAHKDQEQTAESPVDTAGDHELRGAPSGKRAQATRRRKIGALAAAMAVLLAGAAVGSWKWVRPAMPTISASRPLTRFSRVMFPDRHLMHFPGLVSDGTRVYFSQGASDPSWGEKLAQVALAGGAIANVPTPFQRQILHGISPDGAKLLVQQQTTALGLATREGLLWAVPVAGQGSMRLGDVLAHDASWSSDGRQLAYANGEDLYVAGWDGSNPRKLVTTPGRAYWIRWAPDDSSLRFTLTDRNFRTALWEVRADGSVLRRLFSEWRRGAQPCCGEWSPDGRYFVFLGYENGQSDVWMRREFKGFWRIGSEPVRLTSGPLSFASVSFSRDGRRLLAVSPQGRGEVVRFDLKSRQIKPFLPGFFPMEVRFSPDRKWMVYSERLSRTLWRSRVDGSEALQLTTPPLQAGWPCWSPDGKQIAFIGHTPGGAYKLYMVPSTGGAARQLIAGGRQEIDPSWSPDGNSIMFGRPADVLAEPGMPKAIYLLNLKTDQTTILPGSQGMFSPQWTPDGRFVVAMPHKNWDRLMRFDFSNQRWSELVPYDAAQLTLSPDGEWVYFESEHNGRNLSRARLLDGRIERLLDVAEVARGTLMTCGSAFGVDLDGAPLLSCGVNASELYVLDLDLH